MALAVVAGALVAAGPAGAAPFVYVANGVSEFTPGTNVFQYDAPLSSFGALQALTPPTVTTGSGPRGVAVSPDGKSAYVTNWNVGMVSQYDVDPATGVLSAKAPATVAAGTTPFGVAVSPDGKSAYVTREFGFTVSQYDVNPTTGALSAKTPATVAAGPSRGVAVSPDGKSAYVTDWDTGTVFQYNVDPTTGTLSAKAPATVPSDIGPHGVVVSPDGKNAYVTNEAAGTVSQYDVDPATGALSAKTPATVSAISPESAPQGMAVTPDGKSVYVTNASAGAVSQYDVDPTTGALSDKTPANVGSDGGSHAVAVSPDGRSAYVTNSDGTVSQYHVDPATGALSAKAPPTVETSTGDSKFGVAITPDADVSVAVSAPASVKSGSTLTYTIVATNAGPSSAWQVMLRDNLPFGTQFLSASTTSGSCTAPAPKTKGGTITCQLGTLAKGATGGTQQVLVKITARPNQGVITNAAKASSVTPDRTPSNNTTTVQTTVTK